MDVAQVVKSVAESLGLLENGDLVPLDSMTMIDFTLEIEDRLKIRIPSAQMGVENFENIASVTAMVLRVSKLD